MPQKEVQHMKLDVGCGRNKAEGAIGVDVSKESYADVICDIEKSLPFKDDVFDEIYCHHIIEHVGDLIRLMEELHRVGKNKAKIFVTVPYYASAAAFSDPTHRRFITERTFDYFTGARCPLYTKSRFTINKISYEYGIIPRIFFFIPKFLFRRFLFNSTRDIFFELEVVK